MHPINLPDDSPDDPFPIGLSQNGMHITTDFSLQTERFGGLLVIDVPVKFPEPVQFGCHVFTFLLQETVTDQCASRENGSLRTESARLGSTGTHVGNEVGLPAEGNSG